MKDRVLEPGAAGSWNRVPLGLGAGCRLVLEPGAACRVEWATWIDRVRLGDSDELDPDQLDPEEPDSERPG